MKKQIVLFAIIAAALAASSTFSRAQDAAKSDSTNSMTASPKKHGSLPFHGKASAVDTAAMTITVGQMTLNITSETKITKDGAPATLSDITVGETVGGSYKKDEAGKMTAATLHAGEKMKKKKTDSQ